MRLEHELVFCCARTTCSQKDKDKIVELLHSDLDWSLVVEFVHYHGLISVFYWSIKNFSHLVDSESLNYLDRAFKQNTCHSLFLTQELIKVIRCFQTEEIPVLAFKGPLLAQLAYQNLALREFIDLDIIVPESAVHQASTSLTKQGYVPQFQFNQWQENRYIKIRSEHNFYSTERDISVDLHWSIIPKYFSFHAQPDIIWQNPEYQSILTLANQPIPTLSSEALLLFLCAHSCKHDWSHLCWVCDISELLNQCRDLNWDWINQEVGNLGTQTMLNLGLWLASTYFDAPLPEVIYSQLKDDAKIHQLTQCIESKWLTISPQSESSFFIGKTYVQTMDSWRDRLWYWLDYIATPTPLEWEIISLPSWLFFLYYPLRLMRLLWKYRPL